MDEIAKRRNNQSNTKTAIRTTEAMLENFLKSKGAIYGKISEDEQLQVERRIFNRFSGRRLTRPDDRGRTGLYAALTGVLVAVIWSATDSPTSLTYIFLQVGLPLAVLLIGRSSAESNEKADDAAYLEIWNEEWTIEYRKRGIQGALPEAFRPLDVHF